MGIYRQFPYSNFHEMNMDELIKIVKSLSEEWAATSENWSKWVEDTNQAFEELSEYVANYFDNIDTARLTEILRTLFYNGQLDEAITPIIESRVTNWLNRNIHQTTDPVIDQSLTVRGAAADAKSTGDAIDYLREQTDDKLAFKVNNPVDDYNLVDNGNSGEYLRTNGDGSTYWSELGVPTESEIADAINNWLNEHPEATTTVADGSLTVGKFSEELKNIAVNAYITPEMFGAAGDGVTDDSEALQNAIDSINDTGGTIVLKGKYLFTADLIIKRHSDFNIPITFIGLGKESTFICNASFKGEYNDYGNVQFFNIRFITTLESPQSVVFKCDRTIIRVLCLMCTFDTIDNICLATNVCQSMYFINCMIRNCGYVVNGSDPNSRGYDIKISQCIIEKGYRCIYFPSSPSYETTIDNNCIEGLTGSVAEFDVTRTATITHNYFEANGEYIILHNNNTNNVIVDGNSVVESDEKVLVQLPNAVNYPQSVKITNNNVADRNTPFEFTQALSAGQAYTGLVYSGNNKYPNERVGRTISSIEMNEAMPFVITLTDDETNTYDTIEKALSGIAVYARDNYKYHSNFMCIWQNKNTTFTGVVHVNHSANRVYITEFNPSHVGFATFVESTGNIVGVYRKVDMTAPE